MVIAFKEWLLDLLTEREVLKEVRPILQPRIGMTNVGGFGAWLMDSGPNHTDVMAVARMVSPLDGEDLARALAAGPVPLREGLSRVAAESICIRLRELGGVAMVSRGTEACAGGAAA